jgi:hypothetical protein
LVARVAYAGERFVIERRGKPLAASVAVDDLAKQEDAAVRPLEREGALALTGAWAEVPDETIDGIFGEVVQSRKAQVGRPP